MNRTQKSARDLYVDEIQFLLRLKEAIGLLNRIHDKLALVAIERLQPRNPKLRLVYTNAGAAGIDIRGFDSRKALRLVAEVKTTLTDPKGKIPVRRKTAIQKDLDRLRDAPGALVRYLVVLSPRTKEATERQLSTAARYPTVLIMNALDVELVDTNSGDE